MGIGVKHAYNNHWTCDPRTSLGYQSFQTYCGRLDWITINVPQSSPDAHYFCCFFFLLKEQLIVCWIFIFYPRIFKFPEFTWQLVNWIYIPWLFSDWKTFSEFPQLFQFSLIRTNPGNDNVNTRVCRGKVDGYRYLDR